MAQVVKNLPATPEHRSCSFDPWVEKIPWRKKWQPTPVFSPGESHGRGAWWTTVHRVTKRGTQLKHLSPQHIIIKFIVALLYRSSVDRRCNNISWIAMEMMGFPQLRPGGGTEPPEARVSTNGIQQIVLKQFLIHMQSKDQLLPHTINKSWGASLAPQIPWGWQRLCQIYLTFREFPLPNPIYAPLLSQLKTHLLLS